MLATMEFRIVCLLGCNQKRKDLKLAHKIVIISVCIGVKIGLSRRGKNRLNVSEKKLMRRTFRTRRADVTRLKIVA